MRKRLRYFWRLSRTKLTLTDEISKDEKDARLKGYEETQKYAEKSISASDNYNAHLWYASALGRIGQVKGVLSSLSKARPIRTNCEKVQNEFLADDSDTWYVLGGLYNQLSSAGNLSFGDKNFAISYMRRCIDTQDNENRAYLANYLELAKQLYERDWSASKRSKRAEKMKESYDAETLPTEKMKYYEGYDGKNSKFVYDSAPVGKLSGKEEAIQVLQYALFLFNAREDKLPSDIANAGKIERRIAKYSD